MHIQIVTNLKATDNSSKPKSKDMLGKGLRLKINAKMHVEMHVEMHAEIRYCTAKEKEKILYKKNQ
jgi:hypothetical protein